MCKNPPGTEIKSERNVHYMASAKPFDENAFQAYFVFDVMLDQMFGSKNN